MEDKERPILIDANLPIDDNEEVNESDIEENENEEGGIYCHRHAAVFSPQEVEVDTGLLKGKEIQLVPNYFPCIGEECMLWCVEENSCNDVCEHNKKFHKEEK